MTNQEQHELIGILLQSARMPVGIKFLLTEEDYNAFDATPNKNRMSYCTVVRRAAEGKCQKIHSGHAGCKGGAMALGLESPSTEVLSGQRREAYGTYRDLGTCRQISKHMTYCKHKTFGVAVMPLEAFHEAPDVVIMVCDTYDGMRLIQGFAYHNGHASDIKLSGMQAICQECTSLPYEEGQLNISLLCSGTRMLAGWKRNELALGMPYRIFSDIVDGLTNTVNPLERNNEKKVIQQKLEKSGSNKNLEIIYDRNYDDGAYTGGPVTE